MPDKPRKIVIATSLSAASEEVMRAGAAVARATGAVPWLVHAYSLPLFPPELGAGGGRWIEQHAEAQRAQVAQQAYRAGLTELPGFAPGRIRLTTDPPPRAIVELARREMADLIVLGAAECGALQRIVLGSTADGVIRRAPCPVLVVRSAAAFPPARVEIPVDLSPASATVLRLGVDFLARLGVGLGETEALFVLSRAEVGGLFHFTAEQIERFALDELHRFLASHGASVERVRVRSGYPGQEILAVLAERRAELVVLGTHGRRGLERLLVGSVAAEVMHGAACNLLVVPPEAGELQEAGEGAARERLGADWRYVADEDPPWPVSPDA